MSTTAASGTGWSREWPHRADAGDEYYFVRRVDRLDVVVMGFSMGKAWLNGVEYDRSEMRSHLFLGPLKPEDFEQLVRLQAAANDALRFMQWNADPTAEKYPNDLPQGYDVIAALRHALSPPKGNDNVE
jgi:hypothetical protein